MGIKSVRLGGRYHEREGSSGYVREAKKRKYRSSLRYSGLAVSKNMGHVFYNHQQPLADPALTMIVEELIKRSLFDLADRFVSKMEFGIESRKGAFILEIQKECAAQQKLKCF